MKSKKCYFHHQYNTEDGQNDVRIVFLIYMTRFTMTLTKDPGQRKVSCNGKKNKDQFLIFIRKYCQLNVNILLIVWWKFRQLAMRAKARPLGQHFYLFLQWKPDCCDFQSLYPDMLKYHDNLMNYPKRIMHDFELAWNLSRPHVMSKFGLCRIYNHTDSIIYFYYLGEYIPIEIYLGKLTNLSVRTSAVHDTMRAIG